MMTSDGQIVTPGSVSLTGQGPARTAQATRITPDGRFSFSGVAPGPYNVTSQGVGVTANQYAVANIEVAGADVQGVQLTMRPMMTLAGRMEFRGGGVAPALAGRRIPVRAVSSLPGA